MLRLLKFIVVLAVVAWLCARYPKARALVEAPVQYAHGVASTVELFNLQKAVLVCKSLYDRYPTLAEFSRYVEENFDSRGRSVFVDSWNTKYAYGSTPNSYEIRSAGPDRKMNTADDLVVAQKD